MPQTEGRLQVRDMMDSGRLRPLGRQVLAASAAVLIAAIMLLAISFSNLHRGYLASLRTNDTVMAITGVEAKLLGIEMTVRGYALTGDPSFLEWQASERRGLDGLVQKLRKMIDAEPSQEERFVLTRTLIRRRLDLYAYLSTAKHVGEVAKAISDPATRQVMTDARHSLLQLRQAEIALLRQRQDALVREGRQSLYFAIGIVVLAFVVGGLGLVMARSGVTRKA